MNFQTFLCRTLPCIILSASLLPSNTSLSNPIKLPDLGDATSAYSSPEKEYALGQGFLRAFRRQAPLQDDPLIHAYLNDLIHRLAYYSLLDNKQFSLLVVDSAAFNAFAVPGNVIGVNTGLISYADTEDQLSSVLTHELAHLSQRHYARSMQQQQSSQALTLAGLLGSLLILAAGNPEAGMAALTATQAAAISDRLKYTRLHEQEADRIGMQNLAESGMNPAAAANMFQHMLISMRYRKDVKEFDFLLTHPLTESRVADAFNQARAYPAKEDQDSFAFHLIKARIRVLNSKHPKKTIKFFQTNADVAKFKQANQYGLALAYMEDEQLDKAAPIIHSLYRDSPQRKSYALIKAQLFNAQEKYAEAISLLEQHLSLSPHNYPFSMALAKIYLLDYKPEKASKILIDLSRHGHKDNPDVWYLLAETQGLAGNIAGVHLARAEFFIQIGAFTQAQRHLKLALPMVEDNLQQSARTQIRIQQVMRMLQSQQL